MVQEELWAILSQAQADGFIPHQAERFHLRGLNLGAKISQYLYDPDTGFFYDRLLDGKFSSLKSCAGFAPLFAGTCTAQQAAPLVEHLTDPGEFASPVPVPSISLDDKSYGTDMWRGPSWLNWTYMIVLGLERYGYRELASEIGGLIVREVEKWYGRSRVLFEYFDSRAEVSPAQCDRKGPVSGQYLAHKIIAIRDYNWTAGCYLLLTDDLRKKAGSASMGHNFSPELPRSSLALQPPSLYF